MVTYNRLVTRYNALKKDTKPTRNVRNGDTYYEMDSKRLFIFDEQNSDWCLIKFDPFDPDNESDIVGIGLVGYMKLKS